MIIKLDMQKAFDRVSWVFLLQILKNFGFSEHFCLMVKNRLNSNYFSILLNGTPICVFKTTQGVKQGDPLSRLLFVIMDSVLFRGLNSLLHMGSLVPYSVPRGYMQLSHLSFANDIIIYVNGRISSLCIPMGFLDQYKMCSGQKINHLSVHSISPLGSLKGILIKSII